MIKVFRGQYSWLSNFAKLHRPILDDGINYPSVEHFYVAMKTLDRDKRIEVSKHPDKGLKELGRTLEIREGWEDGDIRLEVMEFAIREKFSKKNFSFRRRLLKTGDEYIREGNLWGDSFWGFDIRTARGKNMLGKIIMKIRKEIQEEVDEEKNKTERFNGL